jgi:hypothetical protein
MVRIQVDPVQALDIQHRMTIQKLRSCHDTRHDDHLRQPTL